MNALVMGLYAEGRTDERFLPIIIQRTSQEILIRHDRDIEARTPIVIRKKASVAGLDQAILQAALEARGYHLLVIHSDADNYDYHQALQERFEPGKERVQQMKAQKPMCEHLVPIIPVRMVEAWMLVDADALQTMMRVTLNRRNSGLPGRARLVESERNPKEILRKVVQKAYPDQSRLWNRIMGELYETLAPMISLERLKQVPSYLQFVEDLTQTLKALNLIQ